METTLRQRLTALMPRLEQHPSFPNALPAIIAERRPETTCGDCETIDHAIDIGLHVEHYVALQWRHRRARHGAS